ncbi:hypothetical protein AVEN_225319-1 [Araneus ventricosus]|uniref:PiggyBac transposable element-derived protein domain-containing protein n=1 Tax=Araneus ventricosus TaxID=182803 RepID=A0A4Y2ALH3_ARAVE|nr:hypothetical protein AVEN_225319-1 [Araneus ventricosus]
MKFVANVNGVDVPSVIWKDNRCVIFLPTFTAKLPKESKALLSDQQEVGCPEVVTIYNKRMGGVDLLDSHLGRYRIRLKAKKWYLMLFYHLLDPGVINSWILYKEVSFKKIPKL